MGVDVVGTSAVSERFPILTAESKPRLRTGRRRVGYVGPCAHKGMPGLGGVQAVDHTEGAGSWGGCLMRFVRHSEGSVAVVIVRGRGGLDR